MPNPKRTDPYAGFNFRVEIDGVDVGAFTEVSGLDSETEVIEYRTGDMRAELVREAARASRSTRTSSSSAG